MNGTLNLTERVLPMAAKPTPMGWAAVLPVGLVEMDAVTVVLHNPIWWNGMPG